MLILAQDVAIEAALIATAATLPSTAHDQPTIRCLTGDLHPALAALRAEAPTGAIGFVARDEPSVIEALTAGADEAAVFDPSHVASLVAFLDRTRLRAGQRAETQRLQAAFAHAEKLAALGTLVAGVGHEINNPLSAVLLSITALQRHTMPVLDAAAELVTASRDGMPISPALASKLQRLSPEHVRRDVPSVLEDVNAAASSIASIVRDLRVFARSDEQETPELVNVPELIDHVLRLLGRDVSNYGVVARDYEADVPMLVIPRNRLTQVLTNLLINAAHAIAEVERPAHRVQISVRTDAEFLAIAISDTGAGIAPSAIERIFDPFYTTKRQELGTGLGLSISRSILRKLGGDLTVESVYGEGATFLCFLPLPSSEATRIARESMTPMIGTHGDGRSKSVMVVDDDPRMLRAYARLLNNEHRVMVAHDASEAIELLETGSKPDVLVLEIDLPARDGARLLAWVEQHRPALAASTVIVTASDAEARHAHAIAHHSGPVLYKPVRGETLITAIAALSG